MREAEQSYENVIISHHLSSSIAANCLSSCERSARRARACTCIYCLPVLWWGFTRVTTLQFTLTSLCGCRSVFVPIFFSSPRRKCYEMCVPIAYCLLYCLHIACIQIGVTERVCVVDVWIRSFSQLPVIVTCFADS